LVTYTYCNSYNHSPANERFRVHPVVLVSNIHVTRVPSTKLYLLRLKNDNCFGLKGHQQVIIEKLLKAVHVLNSADVAQRLMSIAKRNIRQFVVKT
jgi:hypothetical protein